MTSVLSPPSDSFPIPSGSGAYEVACVEIEPNPDLIIPDTLPLNSLVEIFDWYRTNLCTTRLEDPRGFRIRFVPETFVHLIKLKNKFGREPKNARMTIDQIRRGRIKLREGNHDAQRACELSWARLIVTEPDRICVNWKENNVTSGEAYIKNFGSTQSPKFRILICQVHGTSRDPVTIFPREEIRGKELNTLVWP
jgi:hypothetical protein